MSEQDMNEVTREVLHDDALVARCQRDEHDEPAFEALYRRYAGKMYQHLLVLLGPGPETDDALQQLFMQAFRNIRRYDGRAPFPAWLHGFAVNIGLNSQRSRRRRNRAMAAFVDEAPQRAPRVAASPEGQVVAAQQAARVDHHLAKVSPKRRLAFLLYYVEELELAEVAKRLGTSADTAWARIKRTRVELLTAMAREDRATARRQGASR